MKVRQVRVPDAEWQQFRKNGGSAWLRSLLSQSVEDNGRDDLVRALLHEHQDGLSVSEILAHLRLMNPPVRTSEGALRTLLEAMPDTYIDRWFTVNAGTFGAIWCAVKPPPNSPKPSKPRKATTPCQPERTTPP